MSVEEHELRVKSTGGAEAYDLSKKLLEVERALKDLHAAYAAGSVTASRYKEEIRDLAQEQTRLTRAIEGQATAAGRAEASGANVGRGLSRGLGEAGGAFKTVGYKMQVFGQTLDDLQYVGEQGIRPIVNNLMQISPAVGIATIAFKTLYDHADEARAIGKALADTWVGSMDDAAGGTSHLSAALTQLSAAGSTLKGWVSDYLEGLDKISGYSEKAAKAAAKAFVAAPTTGAKAEGKNLTGAIDAYGHGKFMDDVIARRAKEAPGAFSGPDKDAAVAAEKARLMELYKRAGTGDTSAIAGLRTATEHTGVGAAMEAGTPEAIKARDEERKKYDDEVNDAMKRRAKAEDDATRALQERYNVQASTTGTAPEAYEIAREMLRTGLATDAGSASVLSGNVKDKLQAGYEAAVAKRAGEKGLTNDQAAADIGHDHATKKVDELEKANKKFAAAAEKKAKEAMPDLDHLTDLARLTERAGGDKISPDAMARQTILASGSTLSLDEARAAVDASLKGSDGRIDKKFRDRADRAGTGADHLRASTTTDAADEARRIQAGVGGQADEMRKHGSQFDRMIDLLLGIKDKPVIRAGARH